VVSTRRCGWGKSPLLKRKITTVGYGFMMIFTLESSHSRFYSPKNVYFVMLDVR